MNDFTPPHITVFVSYVYGYGYGSGSVWGGGDGYGSGFGWGGGDSYGLGWQYGLLNIDNEPARNNSAQSHEVTGR